MKQVKQLVRRHGALVSAVTALCVAAYVFVERLASTLLQFTDPVFVYVPLDAEGARMLVTDPVGHALLLALPFGVGFFLSLWLVAPIAGELRVGHVITRAVLATGIGCTLVFIVFAFESLLVLALPEPLGVGAFHLEAFGIRLLGAVGDTLRALIALLPLGVLAGVFLWLWRKDHPPRHPLSGFIDEI